MKLKAKNKIDKKQKNILHSRKSIKTYYEN